MKILLATDGSEYSLAAVKKLASIVAMGKAASIQILSVVEPISPSAPFGVGDEYYIQAQNASRNAAERDAEEAFDLLSELVDDASIEKKVVTGRPKEAIVNEAEEWDANLIVVGSHGRGFWGRMMLGSVSSAVVKHAGCSVLVVRPEEVGS